jgi:hypothetical protein
MKTTIAIYSPRLETFPLISFMAANSPAIIQPIPMGENLYFRRRFSFRQIKCMIISNTYLNN